MVYYVFKVLGRIASWSPHAYGLGVQKLLTLTHHGYLIDDINPLGQADTEIGGRLPCK